MSKLAFYYINKPASISIQTFFFNAALLVFSFKGIYGSILFILKTSIFLEAITVDRFFVRQKPEKNYTKKFLGLFFSLISATMQDLSLSYKCFLEMYGIGFRVYRNENTLFFEIGFSHNFDIIIPKNLFICILNKKQTKLLIQGFHRQYVCEFANLLQQVRYPNEYTLKGIHYKNKIYKKKLGKQAQQK